MKTQQEQLRIDVDQAINLQLSALPKSDQVDVLALQISRISGGLTLEQVKVLSDAISSEKLDASAPRNFRRAQSVTEQHEAFLEKYKICELGASQVALTLPAGITRIEFLEEAQALSIALHLSNPEKYWVKKAVFPGRLESWMSERGFTEVAENALSFRIDGNVKGSTNLSRLEQENNGWNNVALRDLAVAHSAFYILTGKCLFEGNIVRAADGTLNFFLFGLDVSNWNDEGICIVSASSSLLITK